MAGSGLILPRQPLGSLLTALQSLHPGPFQPFSARRSPSAHFLSPHGLCVSSPLLSLLRDITVPIIVVLLPRERAGALLCSLFYPQGLEQGGQLRKIYQMNPSPKGPFPLRCWLCLFSKERVWGVGESFLLGGYAQAGRESKRAAFIFIKILFPSEREATSRGSGSQRKKQAPC